MRLSEIFLSNYGINHKTIRPTLLLDILDSLLITVDINKATDNIKSTYDVKYNGDINDLEFISKDPVLVKLLGDTKATKLYLKLLTSIILGTSKELSKEDLDDVFGNITTNSKYRALVKAVDTINITLPSTIVLYTQYADKVTFVSIIGSNQQEFRASLSKSGYQSPVMLDKLHTALILKGLV